MSKYEESKEQNKQCDISEPCSYLLFFPKALREKIKYVLTKTKLFTLLFPVTACCPLAPPAGVFMELHNSRAYLNFREGFSNTSVIAQLCSSHIGTYCKNVHCNFLLFSVVILIFLRSFFAVFALTCGETQQTAPPVGSTEAVRSDKTTLHAPVSQKQKQKQNLLQHARFGTIAPTRTRAVVTYLSFEIHSFNNK